MDIRTQVELNKVRLPETCQSRQSTQGRDMPDADVCWDLDGELAQGRQPSVPVALGCYRCRRSTVDRVPHLTDDD
jgi:hypothetical protein